MIQLSNHMIPFYYQKTKLLHSVFEVLKPIDVKAGGIAPWFNQPGGAIQYIMPDIMDELIDTGYLMRLN